MARPDMSPRDVNDFMSLAYPIVVVERGDGFLLLIEELGLAEEAPDLAAGHAALRRRKEDYFRAMIEAGRASNVPLPRDQAEKRALVSAVLPFSIKAAVAAVLVLVVALSLLPVARTQMDNLRHHAGKVVRDLPKGLVEGLANLDQIEPKRRDKIVENLRRFLKSAQPIIDEIRDALHDDAAGDKNRATGGSSQP